MRVVCLVAALADVSPLLDFTERPAINAEQLSEAVGADHSVNQTAKDTQITTPTVMPA
jgi:hypothetical protein